MKCPHCEQDFEPTEQEKVRCDAECPNCFAIVLLEGKPPSKPPPLAPVIESDTVW